MTTQVHRIVLLIVDHDHTGLDGVIEVLENANYPNDCIGPHVMESKTVEVEWDDDHPLNQPDTQRDAYEELFDV